MREAVHGAELMADVVVHGDVDVVKIAIAHKIRAAQKLLLGRRSKDLQRSRELEFLHRALDCARACQHDRTVDVVPLAVSRGTSDNLSSGGRTGGLRVLRIGVVFGVHCNHRAAGAKGGEKSRREP